MSPSDQEPAWTTDELRLFRRTVRSFVDGDLAPLQARWSDQGYADRDAWNRAGSLGILLPDIPRDLGGGGGTFAHEAVVLEELARAGVRFGTSIQSIVAHYILGFGTAEQRRTYLPRMASGELVTAIAMTEPSAGSDLQGIRTVARRSGDDYVIDGSKTFITNAWHAGLVCLAVKTDPDASGPRGISLLLIETRDLTGFRVGRPLEKLGRHGQDVCELFFDGARVPRSSLLGSTEGRGLFQMIEQLPYERLSVSVGAATTSERAVELTTQYVKERTAFGKTLLEFQNTRMKLAECATEAYVGRVLVDDCIDRFLSGTLSPIAAAMAKTWLTEREFRILDECVQLHGGYGYMSEYLVARLWADSRVERIYAGTNEIMKELIASSF